MPGRKNKGTEAAPKGMSQQDMFQMVLRMVVTMLLNFLARKMKEKKAEKKTLRKAHKLEAKGKGAPVEVVEESKAPSRRDKKKLAKKAEKKVVKKARRGKGRKVLALALMAGVALAVRAALKK